MAKYFTRVPPNSHVCSFRQSQIIIYLSVISANERVKRQRSRKLRQKNPAVESHLLASVLSRNSEAAQLPVLQK